MVRNSMWQWIAGTAFVGLLGAVGFAQTEIDQVKARQRISTSRDVVQRTTGVKSPRG